LDIDTNIEEPLTPSKRSPKCVLTILGGDLILLFHTRYRPAITNIVQKNGGGVVAISYRADQQAAVGEFIKHKSEETLRAQLGDHSKPTTRSAKSALLLTEGTAIMSNRHTNKHSKRRGVTSHHSCDTIYTGWTNQVPTFKVIMLNYFSVHLFTAPTDEQIHCRLDGTCTLYYCPTSGCIVVTGPLAQRVKWLQHTKQAFAHIINTRPQDNNQNTSKISPVVSFITDTQYKIFKNMHIYLESLIESKTSITIEEEHPHSPQDYSMDSDDISAPATNSPEKDPAAILTKAFALAQSEQTEAAPTLANPTIPSEPTFATAPDPLNNQTSITTSTSNPTQSAQQPLRIGGVVSMK
jgi:hypothetical protein